MCWIAKKLSLKTLCLIYLLLISFFYSFICLPLSIHLFLSLSFYLLIHLFYYCIFCSDFFSIQTVSNTRSLSAVASHVFFSQEIGPACMIAQWLWNPSFEKHEEKTPTRGGETSDIFYLRVWCSNVLPAETLVNLIFTPFCWQDDPISRVSFFRWVGSTTTTNERTILEGENRCRWRFVPPSWAKTICFF